MTLRVTLIKDEYKLEIPANPYPMYPYLECLNYVSLDSATGQRHVFAHGPVRVNAALEFKGLAYEFVVRYEKFICEQAKFGKAPFVIECPTYIDLGRGLGKTINKAYYSGPPTLKDIIKPRGDAGLYYDIELPYIWMESVGNALG